MEDASKPTNSRLAESAYNSPYSHAGAPGPHPNTDPYANLRASALSTLVAMGYDPKTMVERGVVWAEDQDPFGHVMQSQYMYFLGLCFHRVMESYDEFLSEQEYRDMILAKSVAPVIRKYELDIRRQVKYPDSVDTNCRTTQYAADAGNSSSQHTDRTRSGQPATTARQSFFRSSSKPLLPRSKARQRTCMLQQVVRSTFAPWAVAGRHCLMASLRTRRMLEG